MAFFNILITGVQEPARPAQSHGEAFESMRAILPLIFLLWVSPLSWSGTAGVADEAALRDALAKAETEEDPGEVDRALEALCSLLVEEGRYAEALPLFRRLVELRAAGDDRLGEADARYWLGILLGETDQVEEASRQQRRALALLRSLDERHLAEEAAVQNELAVLAYQAGRYREAEQGFRQVLALRRSLWGDSHPQTAAAMENLAWALAQEGDYAQAEQLLLQGVEIQERHRGPDHLETAHSLSNLAGFYLDIGRHRDALPLIERVVEIRRARLPPFHPDLADGLQDLASVHQALGEMESAGRLFRESLEILQRTDAPSPVDEAVGLNNLAVLYYYQGRLAEARPLEERAVELVRRHLRPGHPVTAEFLNNLARLYSALDRLEDAERLYREAIATTREALGAEHPQLAGWYTNLARLRLRQGKSGEALRLADRAVGIYRRSQGPASPNLSIALLVRGRAALATDRAVEARRDLLTALELRRRLGENHPLVGEALRWLGRAEAELGERTAALEHLRQATAIYAHWLRSTAIGGHQDEALRGRVREAFVDHVSLLHRFDPVGALDEALSSAQRAHTSGAGRALRGLAARLAAEDPALASRIRRQQDLVLRREALERKLQKTFTGDRGAGGEQGRLRRQLDRLERRIDALDREIGRDSPDFARWVQGEPLSVADLQRLLDPGETLLVLLVGERESFVWALARDRALFYRVAVERERLEGAVRWLRRGLEHPGDGLGFDQLRAWRLRQLLLGPAEPLLYGRKRLLMVLDGPLQALPLEVLPDRPPGRGGEPAWLGIQYATALLPSVGSLALLRDDLPPSRASQPLLAVAAPLLPAGSPALQPLPEAEVEARAIARTLSGDMERDLLVGSRASESELLSRPLSRYRVLLFATHGLLQGNGDPALLLTPGKEEDGLLTAGEIASLSLDAEWVILSACNTAAADGDSRGQGLGTLARAFFHAGTRALLVSHWAVDSNATVALTTTLFRELPKGGGKAEALRRARQALLETPAWRHPYFWAPFILVGDGR